MKRRALLGTLASVAVAGCFGSGDEATPVPGTSEQRTATTTAQPTPSATRQPTRSGTPPEVRDLGVPVAESACPFDGERVERVVCYPEQAGGPLALTPSADALDLPAGSVTFSLSNDTDGTFQANFYDWGLHKRADGDWYYVTPREVLDPLHVLPPDESHDWTFTVDNAREPSGGTTGESAVTVAGLGGGEYAFEVSGWFEGGDSDRRVGLGARFSVEGDRLELTADDALSGTRDGDTVVVTGDEEPASAAFVVEHVGYHGVPPEQEIHSHVAEQLVRPVPGASGTPLANALAFFDDGVTTVRLERAAEFRPRFDGDEHYYFQYRDRVYEARVEPVE